MAEKDKKQKVKITFEADVILRKGIDPKILITKETEFIAEPQSANGCITQFKLTGVEVV